MSDIAVYKEQMEKCSHCAFCQAFCPVFEAELLETFMPRARMEIARACLLENTLERSARVAEVIDRCLLCGRCSKSCPGGVPVEAITAAARSALYPHGKGGPLRRHMLRHFCQNRGLLGLHRQAANLASRRGWSPLPQVGEKLFAELYAGNWPSKNGTPRARAVYFAGCAANSLYTDTADATLKVLTRNGIEVNVIKEMVCCGMPAYAAGDRELLLECIRKNVESLANADADVILTECSTCGMFLKQKAPLLLPPDDPLAQKAKELAPKIFEVTDYLSQVGLIAAPGRLEARVTYHIPCHSAWTPTFDDAPNKLLAQIPGVEMVQMAEPNACCGAGGSFFADFADTAEKILQKKMADMKNTKAEICVTQCPACRTYIQSAADAPETLHPIRLLAKSYE
jgi:glycolate oxidase iron-sulfur subunit